MSKKDLEGVEPFKSKPKPAKVHFAIELAEVLFIYNTMTDDERFTVDRAITQHLDISPKDWVMAMNALIAALHVKQ